MQFVSKNRPPVQTNHWYTVKQLTRDYFETVIEDALTDLYRSTYYGMFMDRFPVKWGNSVPPTILDHFEEENVFACTEGNAVYLDVEGLYEFLKSDPNPTQHSVIDEVEAILAHEYTHLICEHSRLMEKVCDQYKDKATGMYRIPKVIYDCHKLAQEIQANRGYKVGHGTWVYSCGATEDKFPSTKGKIAYDDIFAALLDEAKTKAKQMSELVSKLMDSVKDGTEGKNEAKNKGKGQKTGKDSSKGQKGSQNASTNGSEGKDVDGSGEKVLTQEEIADAIEKAKTAQARVAQEIQDANDTQGGGGGLDPYILANRNHTSPSDETREAHIAWKKDQIEKEMKRLKGYIRGDLNRTKGATYARPNLRRQAVAKSTGQHLIAKGRKYMPNTSPKVLVAMDNSGSMHGTSVTSVATTIGNAYKDLGRPTNGCYICTHEDSVHDTTNLKNWKKVVDEFSPTGGNCFNKVVKEANRLGCNVVFNIGDGLDVVTTDYDKGALSAVSEFVGRGGVWIDIIVTGKDYLGNYDGYRIQDKNNGLDRVLINLSF